MAAIEITWAGGEHTFRLGIGGLRALQEKCDAGPAWILNRLRTGTWLVDDVLQTMRLGLEGGGVAKEEARRLTTLHVEEALMQSVLAAQMVLMAALYGNKDDPVGEALGEAATPNQPSPEESGSSLGSTGTES